MPNGQKAESRTVYAITERETRSYWTKIGIAYVNKDGSITAKLDALPVSGTLQIRTEDASRNGEERR